MSVAPRACVVFSIVHDNGGGSRFERRSWPQEARTSTELLGVRPKGGTPSREEELPVIWPGRTQANAPTTWISQLTHSPKRLLSNMPTQAYNARRPDARCVAFSTEDDVEPRDERVVKIERDPAPVAEPGRLEPPGRLVQVVLQLRRFVGGEALTAFSGLGIIEVVEPLASCPSARYEPGVRTDVPLYIPVVAVGRVGCHDSSLCPSSARKSLHN